jgi:AI-2 transport protein TqsA
VSTRIEGAAPHPRALIAMACLTLTVLGIRLAAPVLVPFALATLVTLASLPALLRLLRAGVPRSLAVALLVVLDSAMLALVGWIIALSAADFAEALPRYVVRIDTIEAEMMAWLRHAGIEAGRFPDAGLIQPERWLGIAASAAYGLTNLLSSLLLVLLFLVFMLSEVAGFPHKLRSALGERAGDLHRFAPVVAEVQEYLSLKALISLATGVLIGSATHLLGLDFALFWGLLAFLLNFIPNIGSIIAALPAVLVALLQLGPGPALAVLGVYVGVNLVLGNLVEPFVMGRRLGMSTLVIMIALVFWGWVWGAAGMFLAVPLTMAAKIVLEGMDEYRWVAALMGPGSEVDRRGASRAASALRRHPPAFR